MKLNYLSALTLSVSCLAMNAPAYAQIDEIIVTARKRSESVQHVPAAVSAFSGVQLKDAGVDNITDVQSLTPNLMIQENTSLNAGALTMSIRGIGNEPGFDAGVGLYVDDVYINRGAGALLDVHDVQRIEVLKGPQGNLYGRNTIGGAVKYISREPNEESRANIELKTGTDNLVKARFGASGQIAENTYAGMAFSISKRNGYQTNAFDGQDFAGEQKFATRGTLVWDASDDLSFKVVGDYLRDDSKPHIPVRVAAQVGTAGGLGAFNGLLGGADNFIPGSSYLSSAAGQALLGGLPGLDTSLPTDIDIVDTDHTTNGYNTHFIESKGLALTAKYRLGENWDLKSVTAYRSVDNDPQYDFDGGSQIFLTVSQTREQSDFSQELQANYSGDTINGVFGLYYLAGERNITNLTLQTPLIRLLTSQVKNTYFDDQPLRSYSAYGNVDWDITDDIQLSVGGRYTKDKKTIKQLADVTRTYLVAPLVNVGGGNLAPFPIDPAFSAAFQQFPAAVIPFFNPHRADDGTFLSAGLTETVDTFTENKDGSGSWGEFSPSAKLSWQATDDILTYVGFASGFKSGGFDTQGGAPIANSYDPETVNTYSAGFKSTWADGTLRFNAEAFLNDYTEKQLQTIAFINGDLVATTGNVGSVESKGFEIEATWQPVSNFVLNANLGHLDADIKSYIQTQTVAGVQTEVDISDDFRLGFSPKWTGQARAQYTFDIADAGELVVAGAAAYRSESYTASPIDITDAFKASQVSESHTIFNASVAYKAEDGNWRLALEGRNLSDERVLTNSFNVSNYIVGGYTRGRTWALSLGYDF